MYWFTEEWLVSWSPSRKVLWLLAIQYLAPATEGLATPKNVALAAESLPIALSTNTRQQCFHAAATCSESFVLKYLGVRTLCGYSLARFAKKRCGFHNILFCCFVCGLRNNEVETCQNAQML